MEWENKTDSSAVWREAAEKALLRGEVDEAFRNIDKAIAASGRTIDLLMKADLLWAAGKHEQCIEYIKSNMYRFEADLSERERKSRLLPLLRKGAEYFYKKADSLYEAGRYAECAEFAKFVLTEHPGFLQQKKYRELFEFAWQSSNDELLRVLYKSRDYEGCVDAVDHIFAHAHHLTTFGQRNRYRKLRAKAYFRQGRYGIGLLDYFSVPGVWLTLFAVIVFVYGLNIGYQILVGSGFFKPAAVVTQKNESPAAATPSGAAKVSPARPAVRRVEIKSVKLFEADRAIPLVGARGYQNQFTRQARRIFVEVHYRNLNFRKVDVSLPLIIQYISPTGVLLQELTTTSNPKKEYESAITSMGWRPDGDADWQPGRYTIRVVLDGEQLPDVNFEVR